MHIVVKLFPEITIKSKPVRKQLIAQLRKNIRRVVRNFDDGAEVRSTWDRIDVYTSEQGELRAEEVVDALSRVAGIANFLVVKEQPFIDLEDASNRLIEAKKDKLKGKRYVVRVKRVGNHDFTSFEAERKFGGALLANVESDGVDLHNPDETVRVEIRKDRLYIVDRHVQGLGGYPVGSLDPVLSLISGGFDSTVSSYLTMKRGMPTHYCFFNLGGAAHEIAVKEVAYFLWSRYGSAYPVRFVTVPFEGVVEELLTKVNNRYMGVMLKRLMLQAATRVAEKLEIEALVTGEAVAQVSSQTVRNLNVIDRATDLLVMRPLITMDKTDIIHTAASIGTEDFSKSIPEYCGVISVNPTTRARLHKVEIEEERFDFAVLDDAVARTRDAAIEDIVHDVIEGVAEADEVDADHLDGAIVIDVRHPDEAELHKVDLPEGSLHIPFYELYKAFAELDQDRRYLLYCDRGVMSGLHAQHLMTEGYSNVAVYRPE